MHLVLSTDEELLRENVGERARRDTGGASSSSNILNGVKPLSVENTEELGVEHERARLTNSSRDASAGVNSVVKIRSEVVKTAVTHGVTINRKPSQTNEHERKVREINFATSRKLDSELSVTVVVCIRIEIGRCGTENRVAVVQIVWRVKPRSIVRGVANGRRHETITKPDDLRPLLLDSTNGSIEFGGCALVQLATRHASALATGGALGERTTTLKTTTRHETAMKHRVTSHCTLYLVPRCRGSTVPGTWGQPATAGPAPPGGGAPPPRAPCRGAGPGL